MTVFVGTVGLVKFDKVKRWYNLNAQRKVAEYFENDPYGQTRCGSVYGNYGPQEDEITPEMAWKPLGKVWAVGDWNCCPRKDDPTTKEGGFTAEWKLYE